MYDPTGQQVCTALQKAVILAGEPRCTAVMKEWVVGRPCMGVQGYPALLITSAMRRPPFRASPTIWGARNSPASKCPLSHVCTKQKQQQMREAMSPTTVAGTTGLTVTSLSSVHCMAATALTACSRAPQHFGTTLLWPVLSTT